MEKLVSVIVPVYNAEKYLDKCVQSIQRQKYSNIEIILIDDGSTDASNAICRKYAQRDNRILLFSQANRGNTAARRYGITKASGEYIAFVDADDYVENDYIYDMANFMDLYNPDMVIANVKKMYSYGNIDVVNKFDQGVFDNCDYIIDNMFYYCDTNEFGVLPYLVAKMYKKEFIERAFLSIGDEIQYAEDRALMLWSCINASKVAFIKSNQYRYVIHEKSLCTGTDEQFLIKLTYFYLYVKRLFEKQTNRERLLKQLDKYIVEGTIYALNEKIGLYQKNLIRKYYLPDYKALHGKKVVLYGAGSVGKDIYKQLSEVSDIKIVAWCDENYKKINMDYPQVESIENIKKIEYDCILIGVLRQNTLENIIKRLEMYGIDSNKVYWIQPKSIVD